jgi:glycosyltransferase involved in cell wall biosynthesis
VTDRSAWPALSDADRAAFDAYRRVRDEVLRMKVGGESDQGGPSQYWAEELEQIDYLIDASPLVVRKLRHHAFHITGVRPYDYRGAGEQRTYFERRLHALVALAGDDALLVGEHEALGGFGYTIDGRRHNVDTLKFFEVLVGMRKAGLLERFGVPDRRPTVLEIGGGWGGFAYQFKALFPKTTYIVIDLPELFLFSATYLMTVYPDARMRFWRSGERLLNEAEEVDFIFVPAAQADAVRATRPDLLVNLVSFQEMTAAQVESYAELAAAARCPAIYSLNRERSAYNEQLDSVSAVLAKRYDLREVSVLGSGYLKATKKDSALTVDEARRTGRVDEAGYRHLAGTLKPAAAGAAATRSADPPLVGLGVTLRNRAEYLTEAIDSLLAQSYTHFELVLVDDGSTDGTEVLARRYADRDPRVRYIKFPERRGMVAAWRAAFEQASAGGATYFAWGSDHDRWHPRWLETLVATLEGYPEVVAAYPLTQRIGPDGAALSKPARQFETFGVTDLRARWSLFNRSDSVAAGDMVYGLMRVPAVRDAGVFRGVLCPDRLLLAELTLRGQIRQVPDVLWYRRQFAAGSIERQRSTLFAPGSQPPSAWTPPWYMHARSLWRTYVAAEHPGVAVSRLAARRMIVSYAAAYAWRHYGKSTVQRGLLSVLGWPRWVYKRVKHAALLAVYGVLVTLRRLGITPIVDRLLGRSSGVRGRHHA